MANGAPRDLATAPSFLETPKGGIEVRIRVLRDQARLKLCFHLISGAPRANRSAKDLTEERAARAAAVHAIVDGHTSAPYDGNLKSERRLATLLWRWTEQKVA